MSIYQPRLGAAVPFGWWSFFIHSWYNPVNNFVTSTEFDSSAISSFECVCEGPIDADEVILTRVPFYNFQMVCAVECMTLWHETLNLVDHAMSSLTNDLNLYAKNKLISRN